VEGAHCRGRAQGHGRGASPRRKKGGGKKEGKKKGRKEKRKERGKRK
jgi:hypothetical protein